MTKRKTIFLAALSLALNLLLAQAQNPPAASTKQATQTSTVPPPAPQVKPDASQTKIDPAKEADIRKLLDMTGAKALATQTMDGMQKSIKPLLAGSLPPGGYREKLVDLFFEKFRARAEPQQIIDLIVPIYDKNFSHEEIRALMQFYQTPLGKKTLSVLPSIALESREAGEKWGQAMGRDCMREVLAEHPDLANALEAASQKAP
jgi:uncharacterized protein